MLKTKKAGYERTFAMYSFPLLHKMTWLVKILLYI